MRRPAIARHWRTRLAGGVVLGAIAYAATVWLDFEPRPLPFAVMVVIVCTLGFLVVDTADAPSAHWQHDLPRREDRTDEATSDLRVLTSHQQADHPSDALHRRLVEVARARDPVLADELDRELADVRRLAPADIDRILTRIEAVRAPR
ncbi:hypothetical protein [Nocardioides hwasunensis]|uniref:Uncharacterized protein n=1 Tax=Nocardioides hwasunensis TaxID=397258 RepID=A0ABR8MIR0_9ACTN|nr:hypothetical protein [Nocardioides hwasunensis]MBD3914369.1 hypothetical protein [Nocardioides hwasunensis]